MFESIFEQPYAPMVNMAREDLERELTLWRNIFTWLDADVQYYLTHINSDVRVSTRQGGTIVGRLGSPHFTLESIDVRWTERLYNYGRGEATYEAKTTTVKASSMLDFSIIEGKEVVAEGIGGQKDEADKLEIEEH